jgi:hypothetical protein
MVFEVRATLLKELKKKELQTIFDSDLKKKVPDEPDKKIGEHKLFLSSSVVERSAVNRLVVGSNPTSGAFL